MARYTLNERAVAHARRLIDARRYVLDSDWGDRQPTPTTRTDILASHDWEAYADWHPGADRRCDRRDEGSLCLRLRRLPPGPPLRSHRLRLSRRRVAAQGDRAGRPRPPPAPGREEQLRLERTGGTRHDEGRNLSLVRRPGRGGRPPLHLAHPRQPDQRASTRAAADNPSTPQGRRPDGRLHGRRARPHRPQRRPGVPVQRSRCR